jgi:Zn-dependent protease with chaperone function
MIGSLLAILALAGLFAAGGPVIARRITPAVATRLLVPASLMISAASTFALGVAAFTLIGQIPEIAELGPWSPTTLRAETPIPAAAAIAGGLLLTYATTSALVLVSRRSVALVGVHRTCGRLGAPGSLVVVESDTPDAFTTPEATGRIIVTRGMLNALRPAERRALLAHEASHLRHRHTWWLLAADLAAAINPTLRATASALRHTVERWADEDAADTVADRRTVAHALAHAALAADAHRQHRPPIVAAATGGDIPARVAALLAPRRSQPAAALAAVAMSLLLLGATADATLAVQHHGESLFEQVMNGRTYAIPTQAHRIPRHTDARSDGPLR